MCQINQIQITNMFSTKKRGKGKIVKPLGVREMYRFFIKSSNSKMTYKEYSEIIKNCNKEVLDVVVKEAKVFEMPYRLGILQVTRFERSFSKQKNKWAVDYAKSKELGFLVYHDSPYIYKFNWRKTKAKFISKTGYKFKANRDAGRLIPKTLKTTKIQYFK